MCTLRVLRESLPTLLLKNRLVKEDRGRRTKHRYMSGESWWAPLRPLRLMLSSGHATLPLLRGLVEGAWVANCLGSCLGRVRLGDDEGR